MSKPELSQMVNYRGVARVPKAVALELEHSSLSQVLRMLDATLHEIMARGIVPAGAILERVQRIVKVTP